MNELPDDNVYSDPDRINNIATSVKSCLSPLFIISALPISI